MDPATILIVLAIIAVSVIGGLLKWHFLQAATPWLLKQPASVRVLVPGVFAGLCLLVLLVTEQKGLNAMLEPFLVLFCAAMVTWSVVFATKYLRRQRRS